MLHFSSDATLATASCVWWRDVPEYLPSTCKALPRAIAKTVMVPSTSDIQLNEAFAVTWGLSTFLEAQTTGRVPKVSEGVHITWGIDNQSCYFAFNKGRTHHKGVQQQIDLFMTDICIPRNITINFIWLPSAINKTADDITREEQGTMEMEILSQSYEQFTSWAKSFHLPTPTIDILATRRNRKCPQYCSKWWDLQSRGNFFHAKINKQEVGWLFVFDDLKLLDECLQSAFRRHIDLWVCVPSTLMSKFPYGKGVPKPTVVYEQYSRILNSEENPVGIPHSIETTCLLFLL